MIALILTLGFAVALLLLAFTAWLLVRTYSLLQDCRHAHKAHAANHAYYAEIRRRQFLNMDRDTRAPEPTLTVLHFPPPGAA